MLPIGINERVFMTSIDKTINDAFKPIASGFNDLVFYSVPIGESQLPLIVVWLIAGALYFTFYLRLINIRGLEFPSACMSSVTLRIISIFCFTRGKTLRTASVIQILCSCPGTVI